MKDYTKFMPEDGFKENILSEELSRYRIIHRTEYTYFDTVNLCHNVALLTPRNYVAPYIEQRCLTSALQITPCPDNERQYLDFFDNNIHYFAIQKPHNSLTVSSTALVERRSRLPVAKQTFLVDDSWEQVVKLLRDPSADIGGALYKNTLEALPYCFPSALVAISEDIYQYACFSFMPDRPLIDAVLDLMERIYEDFDFVSGFTTISTPITDVLREKKGVCQDFAHVALGCLRAMGLAARYVSGYIETIPPEGTERLIGADASHAWIAVYIPHLGWVEFDPTNNQLVRSQHIALGWGRDYADVSPLRGVIVSAATTELSVSVDVMRIR